MVEVLIVGAKIRIPRDELRFSFVRSSGPGGQNVNKVNSKAVLHWEIGASPSLPGDVRARFLAKFRRRISEDGRLVLASQRYRDQHRNVSDCLEKLRAMVAAVAVPPTQRQRSRPPRAATERRLREKRDRSTTKQRRRERPSLEA
jgi:ribosome-associated protein